MTYRFLKYLVPAILIASSLASYAGSSATPSAQLREAGRRPMNLATALAQPAMPVATPETRRPRTDGLSRDDEDCNYGCIDH